MERLIGIRRDKGIQLKVMSRSQVFTTWIQSCPYCREQRCSQHWGTGNPMRIASLLLHPSCCRCETAFWNSKYGTVRRSLHAVGIFAQPNLDLYLDLVTLPDVTHYVLPAGEPTYIASSPAQIIFRCQMDYGCFCFVFFSRQTVSNITVETCLPSRSTYIALRVFLETIWTWFESVQHFFAFLKEMFILYQLYRANIVYVLTRAFDVMWVLFWNDSLFCFSFDLLFAHSDITLFSRQNVKSTY